MTKTKDKYKHIREHFKKADPVIFLAMQDLNFDQWLPQNKTDKNKGLSYFQALCREIIGQQLSGKAAGAIRKRFRSLFDKGRVMPNKLLSLEDQILRDVGMSWSKAKYVKNIANAYITKQVEFDKLHLIPDNEIIKQLTSIKGIGNWTAEMFLIFTLRREDVFSMGDLGLKKGIKKLYDLENPTLDQIIKISQKWAPYKSFASITLWHSLDNN